MTTTRLIAAAALALAASSASAQQPDTRPISEDVEPRTIGTTGTTMIGVSGFIDRFYSPEQSLPLNLTAHVDVARFITPHVALRGGLAGSGSFGGDEAAELAKGQGVASLHVFAGGAYYLRPQSMLSFYAGGDYWAQLTQRGDVKDGGSVVGFVGVQGALSSRAHVFLEGGYGMALSLDVDEVRPKRIVGRVGVRLKF
jgi:hypothetical protein